MINWTSGNSGAIDFNIIVWNCGIPTAKTGATVLVGLVFSLYLQFAIYVSFDGLTFHLEDYGVGVTPLSSLDSGRLGRGPPVISLAAPPWNIKIELVWEL